ncbi:MAG TPA: hypothetical protein PKH24_19665 [Sedimentisphaerales bacterium]|jgi:hypothetical protein|nr:hypothetical protein [Sedimentisphaerales bacterium]HNU31314.1 hypothetical protein [Sedimentisphaerales bacterium]
MEKAGERQETRAERFRRIAEKRTNEIIKKLSLLGNCSNKSAYEYTEQEVGRIFAAIEKEMKHARARFTFGRRKAFKF